MKNIRGRVISIRLGVALSIILSISFFLFSACSHTMIATPRLSEGKYLGKKIPLNVGIYVSDSFKNYSVSESNSGDTWNYPNLGSASANLFKSGLTEIFEKVEQVEGKPPYAKSEQFSIHAVIEPNIDKFYFDIPITKFQIYPASIVYRVIIYDPNGELIFEKIIEGIGDTRGNPGFDFSTNPSRSATKAIEDGVNKSLDAIMSSEKIKTYASEKAK
ncbi:MAG: hypothetical protein HZA08_03040 [Nitrospirae bacterium]|nr:hypothetical protein [Nitrospirota bacterium]